MISQQEPLVDLTPIKSNSQKPFCPYIYTKKPGGKLPKFGLSNYGHITKYYAFLIFGRSWL